MPVETMHFVLSFICLPVRRGDGKERAIPLYVWLPTRWKARLRVGPHQCGNDGHRRRLHGGTQRRALHARADGDVDCRHRQRADRVHGGLDRPGAVTSSACWHRRYPSSATCSPRWGSARVFGRRVSSDDPCVLQGTLFLCSGSVIHAMAGEQDMRHGRAQVLPVATMAIGGDRRHPAVRGFFSKDGFSSRHSRTTKRSG